MRALPWIIAGLGLGFTAYFVLNQPGPRFATGNDDVEDAARKTANWGSNSDLRGPAQGCSGSLKRAWVEPQTISSLKVRGFWIKLLALFRTQSVKLPITWRTRFMN
jgi:hypothetical protein